MSGEIPGKRFSDADRAEFTGLQNAVKVSMIGCSTQVCVWALVDLVSYLALLPKNAAIRRQIAVAMRGVAEYIETGKAP